MRNDLPTAPQDGPHCSLQRCLESLAIPFIMYGLLVYLGGYVGIILGLNCGYFGIILGLYIGHIGIIENGNYYCGFTTLHVSRTTGARTRNSCRLNHCSSLDKILEASNALRTNLGSKTSQSATPLRDLVFGLIF